MNAGQCPLRGDDEPRDDHRRDAEHKLQLPRLSQRALKNPHRSGARAMMVGRRDELVGASCRVQISNVVTRGFVTSAELWTCRRAHARARETRETVRWPPAVAAAAAARSSLLFGTFIWFSARKIRGFWHVCRSRGPRRAPFRSRSLSPEFGVYIVVLWKRRLLPVNAGGWIDLRS